MLRTQRQGTRLIAAVAIGLGGYLHFDLWRDVYRRAEIREMFLLNVFASAFLAVAILAPLRQVLMNRLVALGGLALAGGSLLAFALSRGPGLPTPHGLWKESGLSPEGIEFLGASTTLVVLIAEGIALLACLRLLTTPKEWEREPSSA